MLLMKYLKKQLLAYNNKIVWLASYPKSGNTWFRCFLSALFTGEVDLAKLKTDGIFSSRSIFDVITCINSRYLLDNEVLNMMPEVFTERATATHKKELQFVKVHDAYTQNELDQPIFPKGVSHRVIYLVRNPLDVVGSLAHHNASTIDQAIDLMNDPNGYLAGSVKGLNINSQFRQLMFDWSGHVKSWLDQSEIPVTVVRYEDMLHNSQETFAKIISELGIKASTTAIKRAIRMTEFSKLQKKEKEKGFREKNIRSENFFRSGKTGKYEEELTAEQIESIIETHREVMGRLNYL